MTLYLTLISTIALLLCGVAVHAFADIAQSQYVGKHMTYDLESYVYAKNTLLYELSGQVKYKIVSFDLKSGEFTITKSVDLKSQDGTKFIATQDFRSRLDHPLSLFDTVSYIDPIFPGKTEFALKKTKDSTYDLGIVRRDLLEQQTVLNKSIEPTLVYTLKGSVKVFDNTTIPSDIALDLKSVSLDGVKDKTIYNAVLEDYGPKYDYYKNMKFSLKITAVDSNFKNGKATEPTKPKAPTLDSKYLTYENKQYGFSMKYPSSWQKQELLQKDPTSNSVSIVRFTPSQSTVCGVGLLQDNKDYKGLGEKQFLAKMKKQISDACLAAASSGVSCSEITTSSDIHKNGYKLYSVYYSATVPSEQGTATVIEMTTYIPDGNDIWSLQIFSTSSADLEQLAQDLGSSLDTFKIYDYQGVKASKTTQKQTTKTTKPSPIAKSDAGTLQLNSGEFLISKYTKTEAVVSGQVSNYQQGVLLKLKITKPDGTSEEQNAMVTKDGNFKSPLRINGNWPAGTYTITATYGLQDIGTISFQLSLAKTK
jgi:hypothetical protein